jgi:hypothetical protein
VPHVISAFRKRNGERSGTATDIQDRSDAIQMPFQQAPSQQPVDSLVGQICLFAIGLAVPQAFSR